MYFCWLRIKVNLIIPSNMSTSKRIMKSNEDKSTSRDPIYTGGSDSDGGDSRMLKHGAIKNPNPTKNWQ